MNKVKIEEILPEGKENAISAEMLCRLIGIHDKRTLQKMIANERKEGALILSHHSGGYYTSSDRAEVAEFARTMENRAKNTFVALRGARRYLKALEGQQTMKL